MGLITDLNRHFQVVAHLPQKVRVRNAGVGFVAFGREVSYDEPSFLWQSWSWRYSGSSGLNPSSLSCYLPRGLWACYQLGCHRPAECNVHGRKVKFCFAILKFSPKLAQKLKPWFCRYATVLHQRTKKNILAKIWRVPSCLVFFGRVV